MHSIWGALHKSLSQAIMTNQAIGDFQGIRKHNELGMFQSSVEVLQYLRGFDEDLERKDRIYAALIGMVQRDEQRVVAFSLVFLGLWPGLNNAFCRRVRLQRADPAEVASAFYDHFAAQIERFDAARVNRIAGTLVRSTEREVGTELRKMRPEMRGKFCEELVQESTDAWDSVFGISPCFDTELNLALLAERISSVARDDSELVLAVSVKGLTHAQAAESEGGSFDAVKKRYQRAMRRLLDWMQEDSDYVPRRDSRKVQNRASCSPQAGGKSACFLLYGAEPNEAVGTSRNQENGRETMMQDMWKQASEMAKQHEQSGGDWLKLQNDGDKVVVVFLGQPHPREVCFVDGKFVQVTEALKAQGVKPSLRVALNVAVFGSKEVKVLEQGVRFFKDLVRIRDKYTLEKWAFEVTRHGAAKDTNTTYSILPEQQLTADQIREYQSLKLLDLAKLYESVASECGSVPDAMIDPETAMTITTTLKSLPREAVEQFCNALGVQRIKDLRVAQVAKAKVFVEALVNEFSPDAQVDPFA